MAVGGALVEVDEGNVDGVNVASATSVGVAGRGVGVGLSTLHAVAVIATMEKEIRNDRRIFFMELSPKIVGAGLPRPCGLTLRYLVSATTLDDRRSSGV